MRRAVRTGWPTTALLALLLGAPAVRAANQLTVLGQPQLDRSTPIAIGIQLLISDDDNHDASVSVRYRKVGDSAWREALPLFRVRPEHVAGLTVPQQFAGSILFLRPATSYQVELMAHDPDGPADQVRTLTATTRAIPADPAAPNAVDVASAPALQTALEAAVAGTVIRVADGTYGGPFSIDASGSAGNPIVIRGQSRDGTILDGQGSSGNVLEVYGSFVHVEQLTMQNAGRALRFQNTGTEGNVVRRVRIRDVTLGIGSSPDQRDFYICDNELQGPLSWPNVYGDDGGAHANDDGIRLQGDGHVVCHNRLIGFGDAMKVEQDGSRAVDFYGNEVLSAYDNALELDTLAGNGRALFNRFTNSYMPISLQPVHGGPVYVARNVAVNITGEQLKFHNATSGLLVFHNTFVSPGQPLAVWDGTTSHHFAIQNNLFLGPADLGGDRTVEWDGTVDDGTFDYNGYRPDGAFRINFTGGAVSVASFAALQAAGVEVHGMLLPASPFASGLEPPASYTSTMTAQDVSLASGAAPLDRGLRLANLNDGFTGSGPDLGALERGCPLPIYGVRPDGIDESNEPFGCEPGQTQPIDGGPADGAVDAAPDAARRDAAGDGGNNSADAVTVSPDAAAPATVAPGCACTGSRAGEATLAAVLAGLALLLVRRRQ